MDSPSKTTISEDPKFDSNDYEEDTIRAIPEIKSNHITEFLSLFSSPGRANVYYCNIQNVIMDAQYILVDGDSLLTDLFQSQYLDWDFGGQMLSLVYQVERFIHILNKHTKSVICVTFFKCMRALWVSDPTKILAREIVIAHLKGCTDLTILDMYNSWLDRDFIKYTSIYYPYIAFITDKHYSSLKDTPAAGIFLLLEYHFLSLHTNCVYIDTVVENLMRLYCFIVVDVGLENFTQPSNSGITTFLDNAFKTLITQSSHHIFSDNIGQSKANLVNILKKSPKSEGLDFLNTIALSNTLLSLSPDDAPITIFYVKAFLIHLAIIRKFNFQSRNIYLPVEIDVNSDVTLSKLSEIHSNYSFALLLILQITNTNDFKLDSKAPLGNLAKLHPIFTDSEKESDVYIGTDLKLITDIFDARLITYICIFLLQVFKSTAGSVDNTSLGFDEETTDFLEKSWKALLENSQLAITEFFPVTSPCNVSFQFDLQSLPGHINIQSVDVTDSNTRLVRRLAGDIKEAMLRSNEGRNLIKFSQPSLLTHYEQDPSILFPYLGCLESRLDEFDEQNKVVSRDKKLRGLQQYHKYMNYYSSSLTGGLGWKEPIIVERIHDKVLAKQERDKVKGAKAKEILAKQHKQNVKKGVAKKSGSKKEEIMKHNMEKKINEVESKYRQEWVKLKESLKSTLVSESHIKRLDAFTVTCTSRMYRLEAQLLKLQYLVLIYHEDKGNVSSVSNILQLVNSMINQHLKGNEESFEFSEKSKKKLLAALLELGFNLNANFVADEIDYDINSIIKEDADMNNDEGIQGLTCIEFQLKYMGHLMPRDVGTVRDERVSNFIPDDWQVDLLNVVDDNESAVIHAPTSSGKTFISYYVMLKILRANDEDLVVYVSPSKELMNQVAASIYAQFGHKTFKNLSMTLYGFFSEKYEMKTFSSQVLVTLPEPFEYILLSSDPECRKLRERIKYVILDEVHCISAENKSECWERLLLLIKSPFLALSATIRNAKSFTQWLQFVQKRKFESIQKEKGRFPSAATVKLISHEQRFSDLSKFRFDDQTNSLHHVHPWTCLKYEHLRTSGYPNDLTLISDECLGAYEAMRWITRETETIGEEILESISKLDPNNYFVNLREISKNDVREFDKELSALLLVLVRKDFKPEYERLMEHLRSEFNQEEKMSILPLYNIKGDKTALPPEKEIKLKESNDLRFLRDLESSYKLPCIIFITDLYDVNRLALSLLDELENLEQVKWSMEGADKKVSKEKQIRELNKELDRLRKRLDTKLDEVAREEVESQVQGLLDELGAVPDEDEVDENYTFAYQGVLTSMEIDKLFMNLKGKGQTPLFKRLMARGIMIHHEELRAKEKQMAEISYRLGYVRILISTSTLALGIHMPCKTVVFYKDSLFLTALQYRQMSGRAGRRGYDLVGNVIFHNIHTQKFNLLNTAPVGRLYGNHIWSTSTLLRLIILLQREETKENITTALTLFHKPFLASQNPNSHISDIIKYEVLFSDHYLMQEGYLFENGEPTPVSALVSFFSFAEPSNFVLVTLLRSGLLNQISRGYTSKDIEDRQKENIKKKLILILCHIFYVKYIPPMKLQPSNILPDLPDEIQKLYNAHNFRAFRLYQSHLHFMCSQLASTKTLKDSSKLPISNLSFSAEPSLTTYPTDSLLNTLQKSQLSSDLISPFLQNSGLTEGSIKSSLSLAKCLPPSIEIDTSILPISTFWGLNYPGIPKNNYIYRMATDAEITIEELLEASGLTDPDLFKNLSDFGVAINAVYFLAKLLLPLNNEFRAALDHANDHVKKQIKKLYRGVRV